jgi:hypothetical protein
MYPKNTKIINTEKIVIILRNSLFLSIIIIIPYYFHSVKPLKTIAPNVPVVYDGLATRISKPQVCRVAKLCWSEAWEWSEAE